MPPNSPIRSCRAAVAIAALLLLALPAWVAAAPPTVTIGPVDCDAGGSVVTVTNASGGPVRVRLLRDEVPIAVMVVAPGAPVSRVVPIAEGTASRVDARFGDSFTSALVRRGCTGTAAPAAAAQDAAIETLPGAAPFEANVVVPATGVRPDPIAPAAPAAAGRQTPVLGAPSPLRTWPLLALAVVALLAATLITVTGRARRVRLRTRRTAIAGDDAPPAISGPTR